MINLLPNLSLRKHGVNMKHNKKLGTFIIDLLFDIAGGLLYSTGIYTFAHMADFAPGGISGLALILNHLLGLPIGLTTLTLNLPLVIISYKVVGREFLLKTARSMIICTIFLDVIFPHTTAYSGSPFMAALYSGLCMGAGMAFFYMRGSSSGGTDFLIMTIKGRRKTEHHHYQPGTADRGPHRADHRPRFHHYQSHGKLYPGRPGCFAVRLLQIPVLHGDRRRP